MTNARRGADVRATFEEFARTRDAALRAELVEAHLPLARYLAGRFRHRGQPFDDLVQVASLGLVKAVDRFEPERGLEFSTYASQTILGELKRHFRDRGWAVRVPRRLQELHLQLSDTVQTLEQTLQRSPTVDEVASAAGLERDEVLEAFEAGQAYRSSSLDAPAGDGGGSMGDAFGDDDDQLSLVDDRDALDKLMAALPPRERLIVHLRYFETLTQSQIADRLGISQMHVSRLLARSLERLRGVAGAGPDELSAVDEALGDDSVS